MADTGLVAEDFFKKANNFVDEHAFAGIVKQLKFVISWYKVEPRFIASLSLVLLIVAVDNRLVADAAHQWNKNLKVAIFATYLLLESRLQERVKLFDTHFRLTFAVKDTKQAKFVNSEGQFWVLFETFLGSQMVFIVLNHDKDVVLHQQSPVETGLVVNHGFKILIALEGDLQLFFLDSADLFRH